MVMAARSPRCSRKDELGEGEVRAAIEAQAPVHQARLRRLEFNGDFARLLRVRDEDMEADAIGVGGHLNRLGHELLDLNAVQKGTVEPENGFAIGHCLRGELNPQRCRRALAHETLIVQGQGASGGGGMAQRSGAEDPEQGGPEHEDEEDPPDPLNGPLTSFKLEVLVYLERADA